MVCYLTFEVYLGIKKALLLSKFKLLAPEVLYMFNHSIIKTEQERITGGQQLLCQDQL